MNEPTAFAAGNWIVTAGREEEFVTTWTGFLEWTRENAPGLISAWLIRDAGDPRHFQSFARWQDPDARAGWQSHPDFAERLGACRALCEDFTGGGFELAAQVS